MLYSHPEQLFGALSLPMNTSRVKIYLGDWPGPVRVIGRVEARKNADALRKDGPEVAEMLGQLEEIAATKGANAVIQIAYEISISAAGWHSYAVHGVAVVTGATKKPTATDFDSQMAHLGDLVDRCVINYEEYEEKVRRLRHQHEKFDE